MIICNQSKGIFSLNTWNDNIVLSTNYTTPTWRHEHTNTETIADCMWLLFLKEIATAQRPILCERVHMSRNKWQTRVTPSNPKQANADCLINIYGERYRADTKTNIEGRLIMTNARFNLNMVGIISCMNNYNQVDTLFCSIKYNPEKQFPTSGSKKKQVPWEAAAIRMSYDARLWRHAWSNYVVTKCHFEDINLRLMM